MQITLNGEKKSLDDGTHLSQLIEQLGIEGKRIAIELNREIIPKSEHASYEIKDGDTIEIVHAIGGG
ncbi:MAG: sulfur carrier protein ThiS [Gammaproteobacteria bacterium]|nr:sulfur carrier protein ThiS [Gammaproteobacteria bacterium]MDH5735678.1 sulfur carrier protein ThiS [Gammaproteobacteria bacterium]